MKSNQNNVHDQPDLKPTSAKCYKLTTHNLVSRFPCKASRWWCTLAKMTYNIKFIQKLDMSAIGGSDMAILKDCKLRTGEQDFMVMVGLQVSWLVGRIASLMVMVGLQYQGFEWKAWVKPNIIIMFILIQKNHYRNYVFSSEKHTRGANQVLTNLPEQIKIIQSHWFLFKKQLNLVRKLQMLLDIQGLWKTHLGDYRTKNESSSTDIREIWQSQI